MKPRFAQASQKVRRPHTRLVTSRSSPHCPFLFTLFYLVRWNELLQLGLVPQTIFPVAPDNLQTYYDVSRKWFLC
jgi:hypothetical protein